MAAESTLPSIENVAKALATAAADAAQDPRTSTTEKPRTAEHVDVPAAAPVPNTVTLPPPDVARPAVDDVPAEVPESCALPASVPD